MQIFLKNQESEKCFWKASSYFCQKTLVRQKALVRGNRLQVHLQPVSNLHLLQITVVDSMKLK